MKSLEVWQAEMRAKQPKRRGRRPKAQEPTVPAKYRSSVLVRLFAHSMLLRGLSYDRVAREVSRIDTESWTEDRVRDWHQARCPLL
jgi:hypothetical protein